MDLFFWFLIVVLIGCVWGSIANEITYSRRIKRIDQIHKHDLECIRTGKYQDKIGYDDMSEYMDDFWELFTFGLWKIK